MKIISSSKRRHYLAKVSIFWFTVALIAGMMGPYGVGSDDTFPSQNLEINLEIRTWYELDAVREYLSGNYILMNDLDSTTLGYEELASPTANQGKGWQPIGFLEVYGPTCGWSGSLSWYGLTGTFDGQGYKILDLFINRPDEEGGYAGLFGLVLNGGIIKDIGVVNVTVTGYSDVGCLVGFNRGTVSNSYSTGNVTGYEDVGGLVGSNRGTVRESYSTASVSGSNAVGGLVGGNRGTVSNSYSHSRVTGNERVGGLAGYNIGGYPTAILSDSYSTGNVTGYEDVGGLVGLKLSGTVSHCFWDTETSRQPTGWLDVGTGKNTTEMQDIATFSGAGWNITAVAPGEINDAYTWNIIDKQTYPFLSWEL